MKKFIIGVLAMICLIGCNPQQAGHDDPGHAPKPDGKKDGDDAFVTAANAYIEDILRYSPIRATMEGIHTYDGDLNNYSEEGRSARLQAIKKHHETLKALDPESLSTVNRIDLAIVLNDIELSIYEAEILRELHWNPMVYNVGNAIYPLLARDFAPLETRLESVRSRLEKIPTMLEQARTNLTDNPPKVHTETAILQNKGNISLITTELDGFIKQVPGLAEKMKPAQDAAVAALEQHTTWLEQELLPRSTGDFRLGREKYDRKLAYMIESDLTPAQILARAEKDLIETKTVMYNVARGLHERFFPGKPVDDQKQVIKAVLDKLAENRPNNEDIVEKARVMTAHCTDFVREKQMVTVPDDPVKLIVMPEFQRGVAVAYCDSPGAFEEKGDTFYAIAPTPADWTPERVTSFFREYNDYMLDNLTVHEAMPGHYLQLAHANKFKAPTKVRAVFSSGTFIEGWATYAEALMAEAGYGGDEVKMQQLKMRLRMLINAIIDQKIHCMGMTEDQAMALMMEEGFQEEGEAAGKWRRACLTSTQLSTYYVGNLEIFDIRAAYETKHGKQETLKEMHDQMLSFGSPAPRYVKQLLGL